MRARARAVYEAVVERWDADRAIVITQHPTTTGDELVMRFHTASGETMTCAARVLSTVCDTAGNSTTFRLTLAVTPAADPFIDTAPAF
jgi:hypothetical protein